MPDTLDFIIIGAQKAGTTTLFKLLSEHPDIYMPPGKEVMFFTDDEAYASGIEPYLQQFFSSAPSQALWGKATPHYLSDWRASDRIAETLPNVKLIAILREPADRAFSHYRMSVRRGLEQRTFEQAISDMLAPGELQTARKLPTGRASEANTYVVWGEYGRLLEAYYSRFQKEQMLVLFTDDLESDPVGTLNRIFEFLGVSAIRSKFLGKRFHEGGNRERLPWIRGFAKIQWVRRLWHTVPLRFRNPATYWFHQYNVVSEQDSLGNYAPETVQRLKVHFKPDIQRLETLLGRNVPWHISG